MSPAEPFPLYHPADARRAFSSDDVTRRFAKVAQLEPGSQVLVLGCGPDASAALVLAREMGCTVMAGDTDESHVAAARERVRNQGLGDRIEVRGVALDSLGLPDGAFDAILIPGRVLYTLKGTMSVLRPLLAKRGRLGMTFPARVGRVVPKAAAELWERRLGAPLLLPRELLMSLEMGGFEPESAETLHDTELDDYYREVEASLRPTSGPQASSLREELALHRESNGKASVSYAFLVGRRKEPGEKPPASRDRG
ncbi:methyltransferase domain-containing protein [Myxococcus sp. MISCRS1]|jgi:SAM-dependent methyltransferase|uniref:SAM-dependent methyltransferase n=1 Tax=Myxococcus TaxID=32 RepID=UPI001CBBAEE3|nr:MULTISPECIES: methyltransferase domain-containing protein [unclassified Myxococcus]MBZ4400973.1 methyltransferase domain-containing protein [Myxococcus sp. AS-1-15]MBZ4409536.1 methyltransferase domain-containing protein [Myxococcus sp. XM-1-1-1]MCY1003084.1 methyltransferase domain-containing protein [Myxococcus sp. MISCRS1]BDT35335.1 methyltransferase domain-containing protein [Myxococcus sp. MH1]